MKINYKEILRNYLNELNEIIITYEKYDDETGKTGCEATVEQIYNHLMKTNEFRLLNTSKAKMIIDLFVNDFDSRVEILKSWGLI